VPRGLSWQSACRSRFVCGTLDAVASGMSEKHEGERVGELPLDFTQFLSRRLGMEAGHTLSVLGSFLLSFEPSGRHPSGATSSRPPQHPASFP
jgi:hypothetical protein